jgi:hypothetical protein
VACSFSLPAVLRLARGKSPDRDAVLDSVFAGLTNLDGASYLEGFLEGESPYLRPTQTSD